MTVKELETQLLALTPAEKAEAIQILEAVLKVCEGKKLCSAPPHESNH